MEKIRIDKWLWSVRIFKSRSMATDACKNKNVKVGDANVKPSYQVSVGETVLVKKNGFNLTFKVNKIIAKRVSATLAEPCYDNLTPADELNKFKDWYIGKGVAESRGKGEGRPTKRNRREIDEFKDYQFDEWDLEE